MEYILFSPKVSILVPVYNVEQYLEQCLDSLVNQTLKDIEIICINDGSTDSSPKIIEQYAANDSRILVIDKPNSGYGISMNRGLSEARGEYVGVVESDDFAELDMFENLYAAAQENDVQVVRGDYFFTWSGLEQKDKPRSYYRKKDYGRVLNPAVQHEVFRVRPAIWSGLYRRSFLEEHAIRFLETPGASFQDTGFHLKVLMAADTLFLLNRPFLHYRQDNAASSVKVTTKIYTVVQELESALDFLERFPAKRDTLRRVVQGISYQTFRWNIARIAKEYRPEFCEFMHHWFSQAKEAGELERQYFADDLYSEVKILLANPERYLRKINSATNARLASSGRNIHLTVRSYGASLVRGVARALGFSVG